MQRGTHTLPCAPPAAPFWCKCCLRLRAFRAVCIVTIGLAGLAPSNRPMVHPNSRQTIFGNCDASHFSPKSESCTILTRNLRIRRILERYVNPAKTPHRAAAIDPLPFEKTNCSPIKYVNAYHRARSSHRAAFLNTLSTLSDSGMPKSVNFLDGGMSKMNCRNEAKIKPYGPDGMFLNP